MKKRFLLSLLSLGILHFEIGLAQSTDFPNILDKGGIQILCKSAVAVSAPADATEDTLATCTVPANAMGANGKIRATTEWTMTNSVNTKTLRIKFGGTTFANGQFTSVAVALEDVLISNRGASNSQIGFPKFWSGGSTAVPATATIDTTAAATLLITCQKATAGETCTLESFLVELMPSN